MKPAVTPRRVGRVSLFVTPWARAQMTDAEYAVLRSLDIEAHVGMFATSAKGPFTVQLDVPGTPRIASTRSTLADALEALVAQVAA